MSRIDLQPCLFVVLGGTGDLNRRKLLPALFRLTSEGFFQKDFAILGLGRKTTVDDAAFRKLSREALVEAGVAPDEISAGWCENRLFYYSIGRETADDFKGLKSRIEELEKKLNLPGNRVFYLATPPVSFPSSIERLGEAGLNKSPGWTRLVIEKPFGNDLKSAEDLNQLTLRYFDESQLYRIDHYLGKETVQNLLVFRFANPIFESIWNRDRIESVQITVAESIGLEGRAGYYDESGVLRDMVQNHLTQLLTLVAMEVPSRFDAEAVRNEKTKVIDAIPPIGAEDVVLGQYTAGQIGSEQVPGYREEQGIAPDSSTPTFASLRLKVENWRWHGVPFYLRTGKRLPRRTTQIVVRFRCAPVWMFGASTDSCHIHANILVISIQPGEGFDLFFEVKVPGQPINLKRESLRFRYQDIFARLPEAYETLLLDVIAGDQSLFVRSDLVLASWKLYTPLLENPPVVRPYLSGTWGPNSADDLVRRDGYEWFSL